MDCTRLRVAINVSRAHLSAAFGYEPEIFAQSLLIAEAGKLTEMIRMSTTNSVITFAAGRGSIIANAAVRLTDRCYAHVVVMEHDFGSVSINNLTAFVITRVKPIKSQEWRESN